MALRVLMVADVSPLDPRSGGERVLWEQAVRLAARRHSVSILSRAVGVVADGQLERAGVRIRHYPADPRSSLRLLRDSIRGARRAVDRELAGAGRDLLHLYQPLSGLGALSAPAAKGLPSLYTFLSPAPVEYRARLGLSPHHRRGPAGRAAMLLLWLFERACLRRATRVQVLSRFSADQLARLYRIAPDRISLIPGGADVERFRPAADRRELRRRLGIPGDRPLFFTLRNLEARMGLESLLEALAILRRSVPQFLLLVGGEGPRRAALESLAGSLALGEQVRFLGALPERDLPGYYQVADAFLLPTRELEGFGLITVEALACGTPVLGTPIGATPEILAPLDPSLLFRSTSAEAMAEGILGFLETRRGQGEDQERFRQACRDYTEAGYTWERGAERLEAAYLAIADRGGGCLDASHPPA